MFIRKKGECYYLVENHRLDGKVKQKVIACLGRSANLEDAAARKVASLARSKSWLATAKKEGSHLHPHKQRRMERHLYRKFRRKAYLEYSRIIKSFPNWQSKTREENDEDFHAEIKSRVKAFLKAEHEERIQREEKDVARLQAEVEKFSALIPEDKHASVTEAAQKIADEHAEMMGSLVAKLQSLEVRL